MELYKKQSIVLAVILLLLQNLTACSDAADSETMHPAPFEKVSQKIFVPELVHVEFDTDIFVDSEPGVSMEFDSSYVYTGCITSSGVYLTAEARKAVGTSGGIIVPEGYSTPASDASEVYPIYIYGVSLFHSSLEDGKCQQVNGYQSFDLIDGTEGVIYSRGIYPGRDQTLWIASDVDYWDWDIGSVVFLQQFDVSGNELTRINLNTLVSEISGEEICNVMVDFEDRLYVSTTNSIIVFDSNQELLFTVKSKTQMTSDDQLYLLADGRIGVCTQSDRSDNGLGDMLQTIDMGTQGWGDTYNLPENCTKIYSGNGKYLFFCNAGDSLFGYDMKADGFERLLIWTGVNIDSSQIFCLTVFNENQLEACIVSDSEIEIASFKRSTRSELLETTVLNYATLGLRSDVRADIVEFNKTHQDCKIEVHDYSEYNIGADRSQGISKLNTDLLAGKIDILDTAGLPIRQYGNEGILEDLQSYLSDDLELGKSKLMYHVLETAMQDGKLYQAFPSFSILTAAGSASVVGNRMSWTLEDLAAVLKNMPESCTVFGAGETKENLFERLFCMEQDNFVDWGTGTCDFTGEEFKNLLEFCNEVSPIYEVEEEEYAWVREGRQLLLPAALCTLHREDYLLYPAVFDESCSFIGYPQQDGSIGSFFRLGDGMAITAFCKNKEAAWSFVRGMFLPRYPTGMYFGDMLPINRTDFNRLIDIVTTPAYKWDETGNILFDENGQPVEAVFIDTPFDSSLEITIRAITQEELAQLIDLINSIDTVYYFDINIYSIVMEETGAYFSGDKAVEDVAELIQHRVSLYISESM